MPDDAAPPAERDPAHHAATSGSASPGIDDAGVAAARRQRRTADRRRQVLEWVVAIAVAVIVALVVKAWVAQAFVIPTGSMENTLLVHDRVLVSKLNYRFTDIGRGDVIVFDNPNPRPGDPAQLIKRVVAVPGDVVGAEGGRLVVNGQALEEPYVRPGASTRLNASCMRYAADDEVTIAAGELFVLGDNRDQSQDGRCFGPIADDSVVGRAILRIWPINRIGTL